MNKAIIIGAMIIIGLPSLIYSTTFYFDPRLITAPPPNIGDTFSVTIRVDSVPDLFTWVMDIQWEPTIFDLVGNPIEGNAIKASGPTFFTWTSITDGFIDDLMCGSMFGAEVSVPPNPDDLVRLIFRVQTYTGSTPTQITMPWAVWLNANGDEKIPFLLPFTFLYPTGVDEQKSQLSSSPFLISSLFRDKITLKFSKPLETSLQIALYDVAGRPVFERVFSSISNAVTLEDEKIKNLSSGIYFLSVLSGERRYCKAIKLIKL